MYGCVASPAYKLTPKALSLKFSQKLSAYTQVYTVYIRALRTIISAHMLQHVYGYFICLPKYAHICVFYSVNTFMNSEIIMTLVHCRHNLPVVAMNVTSGFDSLCHKCQFRH